VRSLTFEDGKKCGMGEGAACCAFLVMGTGGFECAQRSELADHLYQRAKAGDMHARRTPESDYPACQEEGR
jgi:hypothetical protein